MAWRAPLLVSLLLFAAAARGGPVAYRFVDLDPNRDPLSCSYAVGISGDNVIVGYNEIDERFGPSPQHGLVWSAPRPRYHLLPVPSGADQATSLAISGNHIGGFSDSFDEDGNLTRHAVYWPGRNSKPIDLHPSGFSFSEINALDADHQVGDGLPESGLEHALLFGGSAKSVIDL